MRVRIWFFLASVSAASCSSGDFSSGSTDETGTPTPDTGTIDGRAEVDLEASPPPDAPPPVDSGAPCDTVIHTTAAVYVDAAAPAGGKGTAGCPFRTLTEAASAPLGPLVDRVVNVHAGTYSEPNPIKVRGRETYRADGSGLVKVIGGGGGAPCGPAGSGDSCTFQLDAASALDGIYVDAGTVANGIVAFGVGGAAPNVKNTTVKSAQKDGILVLGVGAVFGANTHVDANAWSGVMVKNGLLRVNGAGCSFDGNKGGDWISGTYRAGSGIHVLTGAMLFVDGGATANNNHTGVFFDAGGGPGTHMLSQLTATGNRSSGVFVAKGWKVAVRKSNLTKNSFYGLSLSFGTDSALDIGTPSTGMGNNVFGNATTKNGKAGIFLCHAPKTGGQVAEGNTWGSCPPTQFQVANCDAVPGTYVDVAYASDFSTPDYLLPVAVPGTCSSS